MTRAFHRILKGRDDRMRVRDYVVDALLPAVCLHCEVRLEVSDRVVCASCRRRLSSCRIERSRFIRSVEVDAAPIRVLSLWIYASGSPVRSLHRALKYGGRSDAGLIAGREMGELAIEVLPFVDRRTVVVPVPSHPVRITERGYNHAAMIALGVSTEMGLDCQPHALDRPRLSASQSSVSRSDREGNVRGAFTVRDASRLAERPALIIDDVFTTGATLREAASIVLGAGAKPVWALTMAIRIVR